MKRLKSKFVICLLSFLIKKKKKQSDQQMTSILFSNLHPLCPGTGEQFFPLKANTSPVGVHQAVLGKNLRSHCSRTTEPGHVPSHLLGGSSPGLPVPDGMTLIYAAPCTCPFPFHPPPQLGDSRDSLSLTS